MVMGDRQGAHGTTSSDRPVAAADEDKGVNTPKGFHCSHQADAICIFEVGRWVLEALERGEPPERLAQFIACTADVDADRLHAELVRQADLGCEALPSEASLTSVPSTVPFPEPEKPVRLCDVPQNFAELGLEMHRLKQQYARLSSQLAQRVTHASAEAAAEVRATAQGKVDPKDFRAVHTNADSLYETRSPRRKFAQVVHAEPRAYVPPCTSSVEVPYPLAPVPRSAACVVQRNRAPSSGRPTSTASVDGCSDLSGSAPTLCGGSRTVPPRHPPVMLSASSAVQRQRSSSSNASVSCPVKRVMAPVPIAGGVVPGSNVSQVDTGALPQGVQSVGFPLSMLSARSCPSLAQRARSGTPTRITTASVNSSCSTASTAACGTTGVCGTPTTSWPPAAVQAWPAARCNRPPSPTPAHFQNALHEAHLPSSVSLALPAASYGQLPNAVGLPASPQTSRTRASRPISMARVCAPPMEAQTWLGVSRPVMGASAAPVLARLPYSAGRSGTPVSMQHAGAGDALTCSVGHGCESRPTIS